MKYITPIPIGVEFYKTMISEGYYYVDKTLLIRDLLAYKNKVTLFTRPRRFGKTLAQSMLKTFFERLHYNNDIVEEGYTDILEYGLCFYKKECMIIKNK